MAKTPKYRLQPILDEKERLKEEAVRFLEKKKEEHAAEIRKLEGLQNDLQKAIDYKENLVEDYNRNMFEGNFNVDQIKIRRLHIEDATAKIAEARQNVERQEKAVERALNEVRKAEDALITASKEVQVMEKHKENWIKAIKEEELKKEAKELEEIAQTMYTSARMSRGDSDY